MYFVMNAVRQIDQIDRRLLKGETIPQNEKVFSIFEPHTRWISKGKAGCPVELGVPVCIIEGSIKISILLSNGSIRVLYANILAPLINMHRIK